MVKIIRPVQAWHREVVEITWSRTRADGVDEKLVERYTSPPDATWEARKAETEVEEGARSER